MVYFKTFLLLLCSGVLLFVTEAEATLAQSSNKFDRKEVPNTFAKDVDKKGMTTTSEAPSYLSSTSSGHSSGGRKDNKDLMQSFVNHQVSVGGKYEDDKDDKKPIKENDSHHKAVWVALLISLNAVVFMVIALGLRTGYACYRKFYGDDGNATAGGAVHFSSGGMEPRIFTVMPGHLVLQLPHNPHAGRQHQSSSTSSSRAPMIEGTSSSVVGTPDTLITCGSSSVRSESPPPPYRTLYPQLKDH